MTAAIQSGTGGTLGGTNNPVATDSNGQAAFADLSITGTGPSTLSFSSGSLTGVESGTISLP